MKMEFALNEKRANPFLLFRWGKFEGGMTTKKAKFRKRKVFVGGGSLTGLSGLDREMGGSKGTAL